MFKDKQDYEKYIEKQKAAFCQIQQHGFPSAEEAHDSDSAKA